MQNLKVNITSFHNETGAHKVPKYQNRSTKLDKKIQLFLAPHFLKIFFFYFQPLFKVWFMFILSLTFIDFKHSHSSPVYTADAPAQKFWTTLFFIYPLSLSKVCLFFSSYFWVTFKNVISKSIWRPKVNKSERGGQSKKFCR